MPGKKKWDWSFRNGTTFGFHLTLNPQPALPPSVAIYRQFLDMESWSATVNWSPSWPAAKRASVRSTAS